MAMFTHSKDHLMLAPTRNQLDVTTRHDEIVHFDKQTNNMHVFQLIPIQIPGKINKSIQEH
jgi:hypothetical protein